MNKNNKRTIKILVSVIGIVTLILASFLIFKHFFLNKEIEQGAVQYNSEYKDVSPGYIVFPAYEKNLQMNKDQKELPIKLVNPKINKKVFLTYKISVVVEGKTKQIYESKLIESGKALESPKLEKDVLKDIDKGEYFCKIDVHAFTFTENEYTKQKVKRKLNQAYWDVKLFVE
ncbi:hypothetical protein RZ529_09705 [Enterococcus faecalis]|uniref:hypothetical protein n=1 Tax=Enterococcus TaxID=1350 RepID=UPI001A963953|nr:hypothetical protein [Enterococcus faecalis]MBO1126472.1 hypothetical protein [Enterococcus faecalis]MBO6371801.1 hypothetical protein [Enterococcus faecalis]MBO6379812.1 hypothetical protein [Enterococcus faecalis]MBO6383646.1 hypothetical protein [Enterococcus faecalis]MDV2914241.1 hypothetical protein [Enterococcus faecalis]